MEYSMSADSNGGLVVHGRSFAFLMDSVDFLTWKYNPDTGDYWTKFHFVSKDVRVKLSLTELNELLEQWKGITFNPNEYKNGDRNELDNNR